MSEIVEAQTPQNAVADQDEAAVSVVEVQPPAGCFGRLWLRAFPLGFKGEFLEMLALAWPSILTTLLQFLLQTTSFIICGHLSKEDLDGVALANSLINVAGISIGVGMSTACDTLFSQTYGSRNRKRLGLYLQRSFLLMNCALALLACLHLNVRPLLLLMQQLPDIAERAAWYMRLFLPGLFFQFNFLVLSRYLQNQSKMYPPMVAAFLGNIFNAVSQYVAIHVLGYNYLASAVLQAASLGLMFFLTLAYILWSGIYKETWDGWKVESLYDWGDFIKLSVPGIFLIALEEWSFEVSTIIAGTLGATQLGAQSIIFQLEAIAYMIPFGMSVAVNIRVGQQLGAMKPQGAAQSYRVGLLMIVVIALLTCNLFVFLRTLLPRIFTSEEQIIDAASRVIPLLGLFQLLDGVSAVSCGAIRGTGRQVEGAVLLFIGYYVIGLPIGVPLALLTSLEVTGTWIGLLVGIAAEAVAFCWLVLRFNWPREAEKAQVRVYGRNWRRRRREAAIAAGLAAAGGSADSTSDEEEEEEDDDDAKEVSPVASETESECAHLLSGDGPDGSGGGAGSGGYYGTPGEHDIAFYSDPEAFHATDPRQKVRRGRGGVRRGGRYNRRRPRWGSSNMLYTGRFYSTSRLVFPPLNEDDEEDGGSGTDALSEAGGGGGGTSLRSVLLKRLALLAFLAAAIGGSVALMLFTDNWLDAAGNATTTAAVTIVDPTATTATTAMAARVAHFLR